MKELLGKGARIFVVASGAGAGILQSLWETPGASEYLVGGAFPYSKHETDTFLGYAPERYCSKKEALELAVVAYMRAAEDCAIRGGDADPIGLAVTASVATAAEHRGEHRICVALIGIPGAIAYETTLVKRSGYVARLQDGMEADALALELLRMALGLSRGGGIMPDQTLVPDTDLREIVFAHPWFDCGADVPIVLLPGSFNPIHAGHVAMVDAVEMHLKESVALNISADAPHKPPIPIPHLLQRVAQIRAHTWAEGRAPLPVLLTGGDPLFVDKAKARPGSTFVIGADTLDRMLDPKWGPSTLEVLEQLATYRAEFCVFGRDSGGGYRHPSDILMKREVPEALWSMFVWLPGSWDVSSTQIREQRSA